MPKTAHSRLLKKADIEWSIHIRSKNADSDGMVKCYTCDVVSHWKSLQCGHYVSRSFMRLRFEEKNCHPQCVGCNIFKKGAMDEYALALKKQYGPRILEWLNKQKHTPSPQFASEKFLNNIIQTCKALKKPLEKDLKKN